MDYEQLRKYQRKEKNTAKLVELKTGFYNELSDYISRMEAKYRENMDPEQKKKLENIRKVARDLYKKRERKIISRTLSSTSLEEANYNLLEREKKLFKQIKDKIRKGRADLDRILEGEKVKTSEIQQEAAETTEEEPKKEKETSKTSEGRETAEKTKKTEEETEKPKEETQKEKEPDEGLNKVMVKILKEVPEFVSQNLQKLGPYEPESTVKVPEKEAEVLVEKGFAERKEKETKEGE